MLASRILAAVAKGPVENSTQAFPDVDRAAIQSAVTSLSEKNMIRARKVERDVWAPTAEGADVIEHGSHEVRLFNEVARAVGGLALADVAKLGPAAKLGQQRAFRNGWVRNEGARLVAAVPAVADDATQALLRRVAAGESGALDAKDLAELKKRKLVSKSKEFWYALERGPEFALEVERRETDLTVEMLQSGAWAKAKFKPYNFDAEGADPRAGALHPLNRVREEFRQIFFAREFVEMATDPYVETGFWNFDALFVPQHHPARDLQDTFYVSDPPRGLPPRDRGYYENVRRAHEGGAFGSAGYQYRWRDDEATRLVLRTHTTAVSARVLHALAQQGPRSARYFSIDRVFRNEAVDATHLAEFHQIEGVIADFRLTLGDLIGFMQDFFGQMGVHELRFKPAYNPYTQPSLEIFGYHPDLQKWVEIGNSGLFRPEMLEPMGLPRDFSVIGFGLSLERPTMIKFGVSNIRELLGHKVSLDFIQSGPAVRFDEGAPARVAA